MIGRRVTIPKRSAKPFLRRKDSGRKDFLGSPELSPDTNRSDDAEMGKGNEQAGDMNNNEKLLRGLVAAPFTPFGPDGVLSLGVIDGFAKYLAKVGVTGVFVCGTTGEFASLTVAERKEIAACWVSVARPLGLRVAVHVGDNCLLNAEELARHAEAIGADAVAMVPPHYFRPEGVEAVLQTVEIVAKASSLPLFYYDIPGLTGVSIPTSALVRAAWERVPTFHGVKFSNQNLVELQRCLAIDGGALNVLFGCDEMLMAGHGLGVDGAVGSTYNYMAPLYHEVLSAFDEGRMAEARLLQRRSVDLVGLLDQVSPLAAGKLLLRRVGFDFGQVRAPLSRLSESQQHEFDQAVDVLGIFEQV